jgi:hypothetical protein
MSSKKVSLSDKFANLINPAPLQDPEDDDIQGGKRYFKIIRIFIIFGFYLPVHGCLAALCICLCPEQRVKL